MNKQELGRILGRTFWLHELEVPWLYDKAALPRGGILEIGAAYGGSAVLFLLGKRPDVRVVSVDAFVEDPNTHWRASAHECRSAVQHAVGDVLVHDWTLIARPSADVAVDWPWSIDMLFLDGDHSYEGVKQDFELWAPHVYPDGAVILHDSRRLPDADPRVFARGWQGPTQLVSELVDSGRYKITDECYSMTELRHAQ